MVAMKDLSPHSAANTSANVDAICAGVTDVSRRRSHGVAITALAALRAAEHKHPLLTSAEVLATAPMLSTASFASASSSSACVRTGRSSAEDASHSLRAHTV